MRMFNSIQIVVMFALWPFLMGLVHDATFIAHGTAFWVMGVAYIIGFFCMIGCVYEGIEKL